MEPELRPLNELIPQPHELNTGLVTRSMIVPPRWAQYRDENLSLVLVAIGMFTKSTTLTLMDFLKKNGKKNCYLQWIGLVKNCCLK